MIITIPQVDFNKHYLLNDDEMKHHDHVKEYNKDEFISLINNVLESIGKEFNLTYHLVGDTIDGISTKSIIVTK